LIKMEQRYLFKSDFTGTSKKAPFNQFRIIVLHDPVTLENTEFFHDVNIPLDTTGLKLKDPVIVTHSIRNFQGKPNLQISAIRKA